jgi:ADP-heptose:LPS heptosyltransferase
LASTSAGSASDELLAYCLSGERWPDSLLRKALAENDGRDLLRIVVERLGDLFEPALCDTYARLFTRAIELLEPELRAVDLLERYERIRKQRVCISEPVTVYVLSRITLGADVAVTSIVLDAMKRRFPEATIRFVGPRKNFELFAADPRIALYAFDYPRGAGLAERINAVPKLEAPRSIVVDPDSRLTQLGLLPVCAEDDYFFFESRSYGGANNESLSSLTRLWLAETFGVADAEAYIAPEPSRTRQQGLPLENNSVQIAVSLGVGDNQEKRLGDEFEIQLIRLLARTGKHIVIDEGAGGEERDRVRRLAAAEPSIALHSGTYVSFARLIQQSQLYVGYDSAGQHVAAAAGVPLISIFAGYASDRMFSRWRPTGSSPVDVIKVENRSTVAVLERIQCMLQNFTS